MPDALASSSTASDMCSVIFRSFSPMLIVDLQQRHAVLVGLRLVDGDPVVRVRQHFAEGMNFHPRRIAALDLFLQRRAEAGDRAAVERHAVADRPAAPELHAEAAQVVALVRRRDD